MLSNKAVPRIYGRFREEVRNGNIKVNEYISLQMNRIDYKINSPDFYYDDEIIDGFIKFCEQELTLTDGRELKLLESFKLWAEDLLCWFYFVEERVFNQNTKQWEYIVKKKRLVNKLYLIVGRGAAKSLFASCIQQYFLTIDPSTTHQIVVAPTMHQAEEIISPIRTAISRQVGPLYKFLTSGSGGKFSNTDTKVKLASTKKGIQNFVTESLIEKKPMKIDKLQGLRCKIATVDEWLSTKIKEDPFEAIEQGASKIDDYVIVGTSSEGTVRDGIGDTIKLNLIKILKGEVYDPHSSIWYYRLDDVSEIANPEMWVKANPNIGVTVSYETYQKSVHTAETFPMHRNDILAKRFGIPVEGFTYFFTYEETLTHSKFNYDEGICALGADLSQGDDFCAFTFMFPNQNGNFYVKTRAYITRRKYAKLPEALRYKYDTFIKEGTLEIFDQVILDMEMVFDDIIKFIQDHNYTVLSIGYDPYNASYFIDRWRREMGDFGVNKVIQGAKTESVPLAELKILAQERRIIFDEELMKFAMGNSIVLEDNNGNYKLSKLRSEEKIDNVAALMNAYISFKLNREVYSM